MKGDRRDDLRDSLGGHELDGAFNLIAVSGSALALERHDDGWGVVEGVVCWIHMDS